MAKYVLYATNIDGSHFKCFTDGPVSFNHVSPYCSEFKDDKGNYRMLNLTRVATIVCFPSSTEKATPAPSADTTVYSEEPAL